MGRNVLWYWLYCSSPRASALAACWIWILAASLPISSWSWNVGLQPCVLFFLEGQIVVGGLLGNRRSAFSFASAIGVVRGSGLSPK